MIRRLHQEFATVACVMGATIGTAQTIEDFVDTQKVSAASPPIAGTATANLGTSIDLDGLRAVAGAPGAGTLGARPGAICTLRRSIDGTWVVDQTISHPTGADGDLFGQAVAIHGSTILVGAPEGAGTGSVSTYELQPDGVWQFQQTISAFDGDVSDRFGEALDLTDTLAAIGAWGDDDQGNRSGSVYVFERDLSDAWIDLQKIVPSIGTDQSQFGTSVAITDDRLVVGAPGALGEHAFVYEYSGGVWSETAVLEASDGAAARRFGHRVATAGDVIVVGAPYDGVFRNGAAYVYERLDDGGWRESAKLVPSDSETFDQFGFSVAIDGDRIAIGAYGVDVPPHPLAGAVYLYERDVDGGWRNVDRITGPDPQTYGALGISVALSGDSIATGANYTSTNATTGEGSVVLIDVHNTLNVEDAPGTGYGDLEDALAAADPGDRLAVRADAFDVEGVLAGVDPVRFLAVEDIELRSDLTMIAASDTAFINSPDAPEVGYKLSGRLVAPHEGTVSFSRLLIADDGEFVQNDGLVVVDDVMVNQAGVAYLRGDIAADRVSTLADGVNRIARDTDIYAEYFNAGTTVVQRGILYIYGDLVNTGTLLGEVDTGLARRVPPAAGDGFAVGGDYRIGRTATLSMPDPVWWLRVGGDLDIEIDDPTRFAMSDATIELTGLAPDDIQSIETLGDDLGATEAGFDPSNFPVGTLRIANGSNTVLANAHVNASGGPCEALYVDRLVVEAGGNLATGGCRIYAREATILGTVDDLDDIVLVEDCPSDLTGDGQVNAADLGVLIAFWATTGVAADLNDDGTVDAADLGILIGSWGPCL